MIKHKVPVFSALLLLAGLFSFTMKTKKYIYIDGNNNTYTITSDSIKYDPITPKESSSGIYSGGDPKAVAITKEQFSKIESIIHQIQKDKASHAGKREMGYGTVVIGKKSIFLSTSSKNKLM